MALVAARGSARGSHWLPSAIAAGLISIGTAEAASAETGAPRFQVPVACELGGDCWIVQYFDHDSTAVAVDYACGKRTYDGHTGTDFGLRDLATMRRGVVVVAAASGVVRATRDSMADEVFDRQRVDSVRGRECGNGVVIDHSDGWETQYCHFRTGSITVRSGDRVMAGERLGLIGLSGRTQFPHVEFLVRYRGEAVDPFTDTNPGPGCGLGPGHLWRDDALDRLAYSPVDIYQTGFAGGAPSADDARAGRLGETVLPASATALVVWANILGVRRGDRLVMRLAGPDGVTIAENETVLEKDQIRLFRYLGKRRGVGAWPRGMYQAVITLIRLGGDPVVTRTVTRTLEVR